MTTAIVRVAQTDLAKLIDQREDLAGKLRDLRSRLKSMHPFDQGKEERIQADRRRQWKRDLDSRRQTIVNLVDDEEERVTLKAQATRNVNQNRLCDEKGYYSAAASIERGRQEIADCEERLAQPDPPLIDPRIEVTNSFAACEQRLAVVKAQIKVLIP